MLEMVNEQHQAITSVLPDNLLYRAHYNPVEYHPAIDIVAMPI